MQMKKLFLHVSFKNFFLSKCGLIFRSKCKVNELISDLIIDTCISDTIVSQALLDYTKLPTEPLPRPYTLDDNVRVSKFSFPIGESYENESS